VLQITLTLDITCHLEAKRRPLNSSLLRNTRNRRFVDQIPGSGVIFIKFLNYSTRLVVAVLASYSNSLVGSTRRSLNSWPD
jgi:hypothetical protein